MFWRSAIDGVFFSNCIRIDILALPSKSLDKFNGSAEIFLLYGLSDLKKK
jgi:hypothetical protein